MLQVRLLLCVRDGPREPHEEGALLGPGQHLHQAGQQLPLQTVQLHQRPAHQHQVSSNRPSHSPELRIKLVHFRLEKVRIVDTSDNFR